MALSDPPVGAPRSDPTRRRALAALVVATIVAVLAISCAPEGSGVSGPGATTSTTETTDAPTTSSTTTSSTTTTTIWPHQPAPPIPAAGSVPVVSRIDTTDPVVFLTIDDGAIRDPRVAELLARRKIPATLFLNEAYYRADPGYFALAASGGGSINSHSRTHTQLTRLSESAQRNEICGMRDVLGEYMPNPGHLFRAPYGLSNEATQRAAATCGINAILKWRAAINNGQVQFQQGSILRPGDIVLSHFRTDLYEGLLAFLAEAERAGLTVAPVENYLPLPPS